MIYVYIHVGCINNWKEVFNKLIADIKESKLYNKIEKIRCNILSKTDVDLSFFKDDKIEILGINNDLQLFEQSTINLLHEHSLKDDFNVLYLHTKGVRHNNRNINVIDWVQYLSYFNIYKHEICEKLLNDHDAVGVNLLDKPKMHFSGNFWWSKSTFIRKLEKCKYECYISPETWITEKNGNYACLWLSNINHYHNRYTPDNYVDKQIVPFSKKNEVERETIVKNDYILDQKSICNKNTNINNNFFHRGRFANLFFTGMALHFIAQKNNLATGYKDHDKFKCLGIDLFIGDITYKETIELLDNNFFEIINSKEPLNKNVSIVNNMWCQTNDFAHMLMKYFNEDLQKNKIIDKNNFKNNYNNNNDVFIHVRLGDVINNLDWIYPFEYYDKILSSITFDKGFISSDTITHKICQDLICKYNLTIINYDEVNTIMFGSTCKNVVLSSGTFSWFIGLLSFFSNVYYSEPKARWHGDIFVFNKWTKITY